MSDIDKMSVFKEPCVLAIGIFDGIHLGHKKLLSTAKSSAKNIGAKSVVLSFNPHPAKVLTNGKEPRLIYTVDDRVRRLKEFGIDEVFIKRFDKAFAGISPMEFIEFLKCKFPKLKMIITGENFLFGAGAKGNSQWLKEVSETMGFGYEEVKSLKVLGDVVSSTRLRKAILNADFSLYNELSGNGYTARGRVVSGLGIAGEKLDCATLNIEWDMECCVPYGVYVVKLKHSGYEYEAIANYGLSPTLNVEKVRLEVHAFGEIDFGNGSDVEVEFLKFVRAEKHFSDISELKKQIKEDIVIAKEYLKELAK